MAPAHIARVAGLELAITMNSSVERGLKFEIEVYTAIMSKRYGSNSISQIFTLSYCYKIILLQIEDD